MSVKRQVSTKRGQHHKHKSFLTCLVKDISLTKIDPNVIRQNPALFEKKQIRFEKRNADPVYFRQTICQEFSLLNDGVEFSLWRLSMNNPTPIQLPPEINNAASLCNFRELNRSALYIRLRGLSTCVPCFSGEEAEESSTSNETTLPLAATDIPRDDEGKHQVITQSSRIVAQKLRFDGVLSILPLDQASETIVSISAERATSAMKEGIANAGNVLDMLATETSTVKAGSANYLPVHKKRKIASETYGEVINGGQCQSYTSKNDFVAGCIADSIDASDQVDDLNSFLPTTPVIAMNVYNERSVIPSSNVLDCNMGAVPAQFTSDGSVLLNYQPEQQLTYQHEFSSSFTSFNYLESRDQPQHPDSASPACVFSEFAIHQMNPCQLQDDTWYSTIRSRDTLPYIYNFMDSPEKHQQHIIQYKNHEQPYQNLIVAQQEVDFHVSHAQQLITGIEMVSQNTGSENACTPKDDAPNDSNLPRAQRLGEIQIERACSDAILDIAAMNSKVYIICENADTLLVYSCSTFQQEKEVSLNEIKYPRCISAYAEKNCLFISDGESTSSKSIWRMTDGTGSEVEWKRIVKNVECCSLSVTRNEELLIVDDNHACIHLYTLDGLCFCCVKLPDKIKRGTAQYAVKSPGESFYVSSVWTTKHDETCSMVYEVSKDGNIVKTFGGRAGRGLGQMIGSDHSVAVDKFGQVMVADQGNDRILIFNSNLQLMTAVLVKDDAGDVRESEVYFRVDASGDLVFAEESRGHISVFSLSQFQPNLLLKSTSNIGSQAISGTEELRLLCNIESEGIDRIRGVATLTDCIYVLRKTGITVYNCMNPYKKEYQGDVGVDLWDIAADVSDKRLYATDKATKCVWSVGIDLRHKKWLEDIGSPYTLSVTKDASVLILSNKDQSLEIHNKDGLQQKVTLAPRRTLHLKHAIKLSYSRGNETYLVCHGHSVNQNGIDDYDSDSDFLSQEVLVLSVNGEILQAFGGKFGYNLDQLNVPSHMVLDTDNAILVADCKNSRVLRLDYELKLKNIPLSKDVQYLEEPLRLCCSENTGQILVANSNSVYVFGHSYLVETEFSASDSVADTDALEPEMPYVQLIDQMGGQTLKDKVCKGAAVLKDCLYIIYKEDDTVYVHSSETPYTLMNQIVIEVLIDPCFIVASVEHNCVYIAAIDKIWRLLRNGQECETFLDVCPESVSVTDEGHLLISTNFICDDFSFVRTYNADGTCIQNIPVLQKIGYAVKSGATRVLVKCFTCMKKVCNTMNEVSLSGVLLYTYGPHFNEHFECNGMVVGEGEQIFVTDKANGGRILVFGSRARLFGVLLNNVDHQLTEITGLCYIKDKKHLLVVGSNHIDIYQLSKNQESQMDGHSRNTTVEVDGPVLYSRQEDSTDQLLSARIVLQDQKVRALQKLRGKLYLLYSTYLEVFPRHYFVDKAELQNGALKIPMDRSCNSGDDDDDDGLWDMAASEIDFCLYVTDRYNHCVWSVNIDHKREKCVTGIGPPYTLSITEEGYLCILSNTYKSLDIYDRSGNRKQSIRLPPYMKYLLHAVQTPKGTYVISWTRKIQEVYNKEEDEVEEEDDYEEENDEEGENDAKEQDIVFEESHSKCVCPGDSEIQKRGLVCEVSPDGLVLRSFSVNNPQSKWNISDARCSFQLSQPCHLAVDYEGRIFVVDCHTSNRVLLLDSQLKFLANLTEKYPLQCYKARRICYDKDRKELTVFHYQKVLDYYNNSFICMRMQCQ